METIKNKNFSCLCHFFWFRSASFFLKIERELTVRFESDLANITRLFEIYCFLVQRSKLLLWRRVPEKNSLARGTC